MVLRNELAVILLRVTYNRGGAICFIGGYHGMSF